MKEKEEKRIAEMKVKKGLQKKKVCNQLASAVRGRARSPNSVTVRDSRSPVTEARRWRRSWIENNRGGQFNSVCEFISVLIP